MIFLIPLQHKSPGNTHTQQLFTKLIKIFGLSSESRVPSVAIRIQPSRCATIATPVYHDYVSCIMNLKYKLLMSAIGNFPILLALCFVFMPVMPKVR